MLTGVVGVGFERTLYRRLYRARDLDQVLLTIGLVFMSVARPRLFYGTQQQPVRLPEYLRGRPPCWASTSPLPAIPDRVALAVTRALVVWRSNNPVRRPGARRGGQPAHGARTGID